MSPTQMQNKSKTAKFSGGYSYLWLLKGRRIISRLFYHIYELKYIYPNKNDCPGFTLFLILR